MKGILKKDNDKWYIHYMNWGYNPVSNKNQIGSYTKQLKEFVVELDPSDANDVESLCGTELTFENKEVRFGFREIGGIRYAKLKSPTQEYKLDEIEQEILNQSLKNSSQIPPKIQSRLSTKLGFKCLICENTIELSETKQICNECFDALKSLILEKRTTPRK